MKPNEAENQPTFTVKDVCPLIDHLESNTILMIEESQWPRNLNYSNTV